MYESVSGLGESASDAQEPSQSLVASGQRGHCLYSLGSYELVEHSKILICLAVPLVMLNGTIQPNGFECRLLVRGHYVPTYTPVCEVVKGREAFSEQERLFE